MSCWHCLFWGQAPAGRLFLWTEQSARLPSTVVVLLCPLQRHRQLLWDTRHWQMPWNVFYPFLNLRLQSAWPKPDSLALPNTRQVGHLFTPTLSVYMMDLLWGIICFSFIPRLFSQIKIFWKNSLKNQILICCIDLKRGICDLRFEGSTAVWKSAPICQETVS